MRKKWIQTIKQKGTGTYFFDEYNLFKDITSRDDIIRFQQSSMTRLLMYAQEKVPYYHNLLENSDIITDGTITMENFFDFIPVNPQDIFVIVIVYRIPPLFIH